AARAFHQVSGLAQLGGLDLDLGEILLRGGGKGGEDGRGDEGADLHLASCFLVFDSRAMNSSMRASSTVSGSAPSSRTALWKERTSNLSPSAAFAFARRALILSSPTL